MLFRESQLKVGISVPIPYLHLRRPWGFIFWTMWMLQSKSHVTNTGSFPPLRVVSVNSEAWFCFSDLPGCLALEKSSFSWKLSCTFKKYMYYILPRISKFFIVKDFFQKTRLSRALILLWQRLLWGGRCLSAVKEENGEGASAFTSPSIFSHS